MLLTFIHVIDTNGSNISQLTRNAGFFLCAWHLIHTQHYIGESEKCFDKKIYTYGYVCKVLLRCETVHLRGKLWDVLQGHQRWGQELKSERGLGVFANYL